MSRPVLTLLGTQIVFFSLRMFIKYTNNHREFCTFFVPFPQLTQNLEQNKPCIYIYETIRNGIVEVNTAHRAPCLVAFSFTVVAVLVSREIIFAWLNLYSNQVSTTCVQILRKTGWNNLCAICAKFKPKKIINAGTELVREV